MSNWTRAALGVSAFGLAALLAAPAQASDYDGWSVRKITHHKDFVRDNQSFSMAKNSAEADGKPVYHWIGYIPDGDTRTYFTSSGEPLTCVKWEATSEWVPQWVAEALQKLLDAGHIKLNGKAGTDGARETVVTEGRG